MTIARSTGLVALMAFVVATGVACQKPTVAAAETREAPADEVFLTDAQVEEAKIHVAPLEEQELDDMIVTSGKVTFDDARVSHVYSPVSGRVTQINAHAGQRVKKGDVLATLESPEIGIASADVHKAEADLVAAEHDLSRQKELLDAHATSTHDYEAAEDSFRKAKAEVDRAKQKAALLRAGTSSTISQNYAVRSQIDGEVVARNISPGVEVAGQYSGGGAVELFTVGELDRVWIIADVYEMDSARVKLGSRVEIKVFAFPNRKFPAKIEWVSETLDPSTRTAKVRCAIDNADRAMKPEMYATLHIAVDERKALAIPRRALLRLGEQTAVFVDKGKTPDGRHRYARVLVSVDETEGGGWIPITQGIDKGTLIVTGGGILLASGTER